MNKVNLFGASGHAKVIIDILLKNSKKIGNVYDDNDNIKTLLGNNVSVFSKEESINNVPFIISIGNNKIREQVSIRLKKHEFFTTIHPSTTIDSSVSIKEGTVVMANAVINASVKIGKHVIINTSSVVEHDCKIADFVHISPNATLCGNVSIGKGTQVGAGSVIIPNISIGKNVIIGAGSVVVKNIPDNVVVMGNPSKIIKTLENE